MTTQTQTATAPQSDTSAQKIQQLRELFADAAEVGKTALENVLKELSGQVSEPPPPIESAGRGWRPSRQTLGVNYDVPLVPRRKTLRTFLQLLGGKPSPVQTKVGTLHDMRFVFIDNDTRLLFATSFDGDWTPYRRLHRADSRLSGSHGLCLGRLAGIRDPGAKIISLSTNHAEGWFVANPELTLAEIQRLERIARQLTNSSTRFISGTGPLAREITRKMRGPLQTRTNGGCGMSSVNESAAASGAARESMLDLHEIQATSRPRPRRTSALTCFCESTMLKPVASFFGG